MNQNILKEFYRGDGVRLRFTLTPDSGSLTGAAHRFIVAELRPDGGQNHLITLLPSSDFMDVSEASGVTTIDVTIPGVATVGLSPSKVGRIIQCDLETTPLGGQPKTMQVLLRLLPDTLSDARLNGSSGSNSGGSGGLN